MSPRTGPVLGATVALAVVAATAVTLLVGRDDDDGSSQVAAASSVGMAHVHGLGVDPADGELLAGTHHGTFRVGEDGTAEQVGPTQDYMGFTVVGPGHYLASGHPAAGQDAPANLGLIETRDGGATWRTVSLRGDADFHALEARHGRVYGHTAGQLLVSDDGTTWERRADLPLADLAVSPQDPDTVLATTSQGLAASTDGGRTFSLADGAPLLVLLTWDDAGTLVGVDPRGTVHASPDGGRTWERRGDSGGQPAALTSAGDRVFVATADGRIVESQDGGDTFTVRYDER